MRGWSPEQKARAVGRGRDRPALPEEAEVLRIRQLVAIRRFLEAVMANRKAEGVSGSPVA
jgi:hypothetical protein